ncbi:YiiX/YebB-like N1pC/P60 family cysteine hydrolase [Mariniplasma anaerobium]|uniref:Uncharacterized protein n=1 Tax=Mariniplasma anaerobium TaxID=2735436 RepID=A0A7U9THG5_9MOLU|nr:YiiX/YebB-like N1pC/P60 family cysteine hydrolase [Mariniplasma anaerobium]BCR36873.1 hypothetical protein MPAN_017660 [Mariniplasma anaerobium]
MKKLFFMGKTRNKKKKKKIRVITFVKGFILLLIGAGIFTVGKAVTKDILVRNEINDFKDRAVFEYEEDFAYQTGVIQTRRYYKVPRETLYETSDTRSVFNDDSRKYLGQAGDIFLSQRSPFVGEFFVDPFISYYFGGHAAIKTENNQFIEAVGFPDDDESIMDIIRHPGDEPHDFSVTINRTSSNYWLYPYYRSEGTVEYPYFGSYYRDKFIGVRVKDVDSEQIQGAIDFADDKVDVNLYNFLFFLDMSYKYYCTDLVSRAYQDVMVEPEEQTNYAKALNDDGFITSVNDIVLSRETYMIFYVEIIDEIVNIYYLEDM